MVRAMRIHCLGANRCLLMRVAGSFWEGAAARKLLNPCNFPC